MGNKNNIHNINNRHMLQDYMKTIHHKKTYKLINSLLSYGCPANKQRRNNVISTSLRRHDVAATSMQRYYDFVCLLGDKLNGS